MTLWERANNKSNEYAGRKQPGSEVIRDIRQTIPPIPFNISPTKNIEREEAYSAELFAQQKLVADTFFSTTQIKVDRLQKRKQKWYAMELKQYEEQYKKLVND